MEGNTIINILRGLYAPIEKITKALATIDANHAQVHAGAAFSLCLPKQTLAGSSNEDILITIPAGVYVHFQLADIHVGGAEDVAFQIYESPTAVHGTGGNIKTPSNHNFAKNTPSQLTCTEPSSVSAQGTWKYEKAVLSTGKTHSSAGVANNNEFVLKPGTTYLLRCVNQGATGQDLFREFFWYEEVAG